MPGDAGACSRCATASVCGDLGFAGSMGEARSAVRRELKIAAFVVVLCCGAALRMLASTLGGNFDLVSWWIVANLVNEGGHIYVDTARLPYGPLWASVAWFALWTQQALGLTGIHWFHVVVAGFLTIVDLGIAVTLAHAYGYIPAVLFSLCPVSVLITGFHSQIDNIAILLALWSWRLILCRSEGAGQPDDIIWPAVLMGLSLATKHVFAFFPLWMLAWPFRPVKQRLLYAGIAYAIFLGAFVPYVLTPEGFAGVKTHVFMYRGYERFGNALLPRIIPYEALWSRAFEAGMLGVGFIVGRWAPRDLLFLYPVAVVTLTPLMADQYLVIPIISFAAYWKDWPMWAYVVTATIALLASTDDVGGLAVMQFIAVPLREAGLNLTAGTRSTLLPQLCLVLFAVSRLVIHRAWPIAYSDRHPIVPPEDSLRRTEAR